MLSSAGTTHPAKASAEQGLHSACPVMHCYNNNNLVTPPHSTFFIERTENLSVAAKMLVQFFHDFVFALLFDDLI
jgi:hypothetical protein